MNLSLIKELKEIFFIALFGAFVSAVIFGNNLSNIIFSITLWVLLWKGNEYLAKGLDLVVNWLERPVMRTMIGIFAHSLFSIGLLSVALFILHRLFGSEMSFMEVMRDNKLTLIISTFVTIIITTFMCGRGFYLDWKEALLDVEKMKTERIKSTYESLKNQVNPHFLFNSLNALSSLVYEDQEKAVEFIRKLADVYRYVLDHRDQEVVSLDDELIFLENFVFLQKIRFGDNLRVEISGERIGSVPPLAVQMLVENAIKHNVISRDKPLVISITIDSQYVSVENNLQEKEVNEKNGIGLDNIKARYRHLTDTDVVIKKDQDLFRVQLPVLTITR